MTQRAPQAQAPVTCLVLVSAAACTHPAAHPPPPPPCPTAPIVAQAQAQLDALATCPTLPGLTIRSAAPLDLTPLAHLTAVDGDLVIGPTLALDRVALPALTTVGGRLAIVSGGAIGGVFLPALVRAGALEIRDHPGLTMVMVPRLAAVDGPLTLVRVPDLELVDATDLTTVGGALTVAAPRLVTWLGRAPAPAGPRAVDAPALVGP